MSFEEMFGHRGAGDVADRFSGECFIIGHSWSDIMTLASANWLLFVTRWR